jgi:hypothetical protein
MKVQLLVPSTNGLKSGSLKRIAKALEAVWGYKVWRTTTKRTDRKQFLYGDQVNKLSQYKWFKQQGLSALEFTTDISKVKQWLLEENVVFGRQTLNGSEGSGIIILTDPSAVIPPCPVYTKYKPKKREFRVHVFKDKIVNIVEKKLKSGWNGPKNTKVRNTANGYIFCQDFDLTPALRTRIETLGLHAAKVCGSDFRGVDVCYNEKHDDVFVVEVNSAPGIEGSNVDKYVQVIKQYVS